MNNDEFYIREAINLGREGMDLNLGGPFGAIVVFRNSIIGKGQNQVTASNDPTSHAEINAIRDACKTIGNFKLTGSVLYSSCEPCPMCLGAIYWSHIDRVVFASDRKDASKVNFDDSYFYGEISLPWEKRNISYKQLLRSEGIKLFEEWEMKSDKILY